MFSPPETNHERGFEYSMQSNIDLQYLLTIFIKHRKQMAVAFVATVLACTLTILALTPIYEATSVLLVRFGRHYLYRPEVGRDDTLVERNREAIINAEIGILNSRDLAETVVRELGPTALYPTLDAVAEQDLALRRAVVSFSENLFVQGLPDSNVIHVSFQHPDPEISASVANKTVELFTEKHLEAFSDPQATSFLEEKVTAYRNKLDESEEALRTFQAENQILGLDQQLELLLSRQAETKDSLSETVNRIAGLQQRLSTMNEQLEGLEEGPFLYSERNEIIDRAKSQLLELRLEEERLLATYKESNRKVVSLRKQIELVDDFLREQGEVLRHSVNSGRFEVQMEVQVDIIQATALLSEEMAKRIGLDKELSKLEESLKLLPLRNKQLRDLIRQRDSDEANYQSYLKKLEEARLLVEMDLQKMAGISVLQRAAVPLKAIWPQKRVFLAAAVIIGLLVAAGLALVSEWHSESFPGRGRATNSVDSKKQVV